MCDDIDSARTVAKHWLTGYGPEIHHEGEAGYYPQFHPWDKKLYPNIKIHPHIWYLP